MDEEIAQIVREHGWFAANVNEVANRAGREVISGNG